MTKRRVLVIEDDGLLALDLCDTLERVGLEVVGVATNVKDALRLAKDRWPDVAIVDVRLSGRRDGIDAAHLLREQRDIGLVFLTASVERAVRERIADLEQATFLSKPVSPKQVIAAVETALALSNVR